MNKTQTTPKVPRVATVDRLDKLPRGKVTVDNLLKTDSIAQILSGINQYKGSIEDIIVLVTSRAGVNSILTTSLDPSQLIFTLEQAKQRILMSTMIQGGQ